MRRAGLSQLLSCKIQEIEVPHGTFPKLVCLFRPEVNEVEVIV